MPRSILARSALALAIIGASPLWADAPNRDDFVAPAKNYSPNLDQNYPNRVFWGDTHLHTTYSTDAGMIGNRITPDEAYRFARGEEIVSSTNHRARLARPLDFLVISDHAENLGMAPMIATSDPLLLKTEVGKIWHDMVKAGNGFEAFGDWIKRGSTTGTDPINSPEMARAAWEIIVRSAERYNHPGQFTAFIGYEWTSTPAGNNLHRNVIFRDGGDLAMRSPAGTSAPMTSAGPILLPRAIGAAYRWAATSARHPPARRPVSPSARCATRTVPTSTASR